MSTETCDNILKDKIMKNEPRYILVRDNDSHWYVIPCDMTEQWESWLSIDSDDERSWEAPEFAEIVGGSPSLVTFSNYQIG